MRIQFQEKPLDLYAVVGYTVVITAILLVVGIGNPGAVGLVLFAPGYVLLAALIPADKQISWTERLAFSMGLSITVVPVLGLVLNLTPWGIRFAPLIASIALFVTSLGLVAHRQRTKLEPNRRLAGSFDLRLSDWTELATVRKALIIVVAASIGAAAVTLVYFVATAQPGGRFTEFYILGSGGNASGYPTHLNESEPATVIVGITNHEYTTVDYRVRVDLVGIIVLYNGSIGQNETVEVNRTTWTSFDTTLESGTTWKQPYAFRITAVGLWRVQFILFRSGDFSEPYRELHLGVTVT